MLKSIYNNCHFTDIDYNNCHSTDIDYNNCHSTDIDYNNCHSTDYMRILMLPILLQSTVANSYPSPLQEEGSPSPGLGHGSGLECLASGNYRDLSAWRVTIPRIDYVPDPNNPRQMTHFFVIDVTRIDVSAETDSGWLINLY